MHTDKRRYTRSHRDMVVASTPGAKLASPWYFYHTQVTPRGQPVNQSIRRRARLSLLNQSATTVGTIQLPLALANRYIIAHQLILATTAGGTGTTAQPRLGDVAAFVNGSINEKYRRGTAVAVAENVNEKNMLCHLLVDATGRVYIKPCYDAGADNGCTVELVYEECYGTAV